MEGIASTNNTIIVSTSNTRVGISTATPGVPLDVKGAMRSISTTFSSPSSGKGLEIYYDGSGDTGTIDSNDRNSGLVRKPLLIQGTNLSLAANGATVAVISANTLNVNGSSGLSTTNQLGVIHSTHTVNQFNEYWANNSSGAAETYFVHTNSTNRLDYYGLLGGSGSVAALTINPTIGTLDVANALTELTLYRTQDNLTNIERLSMSGMAAAQFRFSHEIKGTNTYSNIVWASDNGGGSTHAAYPGSEVYLSFNESDRRGTQADQAVPVVFVNSFARFDQNTVVGKPSEYFIARTTSTLAFNVPSVSSITFSVNGSTLAHIDSMSLFVGGQGTGGNGSTFLNNTGLANPALVVVSSDSATTFWGTYTQASLMLQNPSATNNNWNQIGWLDAVNNGGANNVVGSIGVTETSHSSPTADMVFATASPSITEHMRIKGSDGSIRLGTATGTQIYRCAGGTDAGWVLYGNSGAAQTLCTGGGGSLTATGLYLP